MPMSAAHMDIALLARAASLVCTQDSGHMVCLHAKKMTTATMIMIISIIVIVMTNIMMVQSMMTTMMTIKDVKL